ncbi:MAG: DEAD/DEAH box helicase [Candidatus Sericytochromatia bacterium]|nr:DEAD/DEAH box helicase [Candidatus Sericytochromatia bacterium]
MSQMPSPPAPTQQTSGYLHAVWLPAQGLCLWGEDAGLAAQRATTPPRTDAAHPFATRPPELRHALTATTAGAVTAEPCTLTLWLPSHDAGPRPSPGLVADRTRLVDAQALAPWQVPALSLTWADVWALVTGTPDGQQTAQWGASLHYVAMLCRSVLHQFAQGDVRPRLVVAGETFRAIWQPGRQRPGIPGDRAPASLLAARPADGAAAITPQASVTQLIDGLADAFARPRVGAWITPPARTAAGDLAAMAWLQALRAEAPVIDAPRAALTDLAKSLGPWPETTQTATPPAGLGLELIAPGEGDRRLDVPWRLYFTLPEGSEPASMTKALWRAAKVYAPLNRAMETQVTTGLPLTPKEALDFLARGVPALRAAGFTVQVPTWRPSQAGTLQVQLHTEMGGTGAGGRQARFEWQVTLGGERLSGNALLQLSEAESPLIQLGGAWVAIDPAELKQALALIRPLGLTGERPLRELLELATGGDLATDGTTAKITVTGWLAELQQLGDATLTEIETPAALQATLRHYQARGLAWLMFMTHNGLGACLADDMGLGKTIQVLALMIAEREAGQATGPTLLICPTSVVGNWQREAAKFAPSLRIAIHHGPDRAHGPAFQTAAVGHDLIVTTYGLAARDAETLSGVHWDRVVLDEAQMIKNAATRQHKAIAGLPSTHRVALTGTPIENRLTDLWAIMAFLNPGLLGSATDFERQFATPIERRQDATAAATLRRLTAPFILRRLKSDPAIVPDLPEKLETKVYCHLTQEQATLYQGIVADLLQRLDHDEGIARRGAILAAMTKLKQACNHPAQLLKDGSPMAGRSGKLERLEEMLDEVLACNEKALVFTQFAQLAYRLGDHLAARFKQDVLVLCGDTPRAERDRMIARFNAADGPALFVLSLKAGGTGLNLMAANHVCHFDRWWNPAVEAQATDRAHRIGQVRSVLVRQMLCAGTLEERIDQIIESKRDLADTIMGGGEDWLTELSTAQIRDLISLSPDALVGN